MDRIKLAQDRGQCQAVVKTVLNLRSHQIHGTSWSTEQLVAYL